MSSRALRRLQEGSGVQGLPCSEPLSQNQDESEEPPATTVPFAGARAKFSTPHLNPFDLLNDDSCSESEVKEDDDLGTESSRSRHTFEAEQKKKKKRKSHRRSSGGRGVPPKSSEDNAEEFGDEIERSVREVNALLGELPEDVCKPRRMASSDSTEDVKPASFRNILSIETKNLNPENEMKKIFGSKVVQSEHHGARHRRGGAGGRNRAQSRASHYLVVPKPNWPNATKTGLGMKFLESDRNGNQHFTFEHSQNYQEVQHRFLKAVDSLNPEFIVSILNEHPFHVDSLLQLSDICKMGEDLQMSAELIERALYSMESAFHPLFNLAVGSSRLDYRRQENRAFFIAMFRHLNFVGSRACYRTALEFCKLILSLDPEEDPLGILLMIDFYALRSEQYEWFVRLFDEFEVSKNLSLLPNFAFSVALAHFYRQDSEEKADQALQNALVMFPGVLLSLLDKCSVDADRHVMGHKFFLDAQRKQSTALNMLTSLYVGRSYHLWKDPNLLPWLERNVHQVIARVDTSDPFVSECSEKRKSRYVGAPRNIYRHVIMSDIKDATTTLPKELAEGPLLSYDPLPPTNSIDIYKKSATNANNVFDDPSAFRMFFRSLLPNFNTPNDAHRGEGGVAAAADGNVAGAAGVEGEDEPRDLRRSVTTLLDAMQDLIRGLQLPEVPHDADASADTDDEAERDWQR